MRKKGSRSAGKKQRNAGGLKHERRPVVGHAKTKRRVERWRTQRRGDGDATRAGEARRWEWEEDETGTTVGGAKVSEKKKRARGRDCTYEFDVRKGKAEGSEGDVGEP